MSNIKKLKTAIRKRMQIYYKKVQKKTDIEYYNDAYFSLKFVLRKVDTDYDKVKSIITCVILDDAYSNYLIQSVKIKVSDYVKSYFPEMIFISYKHDITL